MRTYTIVDESNGVINRTCLTSTRKREIESMFNRYVKSFKKHQSWDIYQVHQGYVRYTFWSTYGHVEGEIYIICEK